MISPDGLPRPRSLSWLYRDQGGEAFTLTHPAPSGTKVGDTMVVTLTGYSLDGAQGTDGSITPDPAWTVVTQQIDPVGPRNQFHVYKKVADAADEAGTSSYSWGFTAGSTATRGHITCFTIPQQNGRNLGAASADTKRDASTYSTSAPTPADWVLAMMLYKDYAAGTGSPSPTVTNAGTIQLISYGSANQQGVHTIAAVPGGTSTVTGTITAGKPNPTASLIAVGVT